MRFTAGDAAQLAGALLSADFCMREYSLKFMASVLHKTQAWARQKWS